VTEAVTGLDLVELQLRVAAGEQLALDQADVACRGHAIEVRVVAEQPAKDWLPSTGTVRQWEFSPEVRVDSAVRAGSEVGSDYDSLLAKVIAHAPDRTRAAGLLRRTMRAAGVSGVETNVATLVGLLGEPDFLGGDTTIDYLDQHPELLRADVEDPEVRTCLLVAAVLHRALGTDGPWGFAPPAWRNLPIQGQRETLRRLGAAPDDDTVSVEYRSAGSRLFDLRLGAFPEPGPDGTSAPDERLRVHARVLAAEPPSNSGHNLAVELDGVRRVVRVAEDPDGTVHTVTAQGHASWVPVLDLGPHASGTVDSQLTAALPGTVTAVRVRAGDTVDEGQVLLLMEAMKMEHSVTAPRSAVVAQVPVSLGDRVSDGDVLVRLEDDSAH
jgi:propionyl-CoA carboxylase alpha chain